MRKFSRKTDQRKAFLRNLAVSLVMKERIKTTESRAKALRSLVERLITKGKKGNLVSRRYVAKYLSAAAAKKVSKEIAPRFSDRQGGYVRIIRLGRRLSDGAGMVYIEFVK